MEKLKHDISCKRCGNKKKRTYKGTPYCLFCQAEYSRKNKEVISQKGKVWRQQNQSKILDYRIRNKDVHNEQTRVWRNEHRDRVKTYQDDYNSKRHPDYAVWIAAKYRCYNPNSPKYRTHGARGVKMHEDWKNSFEEFIKDVGERPEPRHLYSLDRYPNRNGNYEPDNVRWATSKEQASNTRKQIDYRISINENELICYHGKFITLKEFSDFTRMFLIVVKYRYAMHPDSNYILKWDCDHRKYPHEGHVYNAMELSLITEIPHHRVANRMRNLGWTVQQLIDRK